MMREFTYIHRSTVISPKLKVMYFVLSFGVLAYTVIDIVGNHNYAILETPDVRATVWQHQYNHSALVEAKYPRRGPKPSYCDNPSLNYDTGYGYIFYNLSCLYVNDSQPISHVLADEMRVMIQKGTTYPPCSSLPCITHEFIAAPEVTLFNLAHSLYSDTVGNVPNPALRIYDSKHNLVRETEEGSMLFTSLQEVLDLAGFTLDDENLGTAYIPGTRNAPYRMTGVVVSLGIHYTNARPFDMSKQVIGEVRAMRSAGVWGYMGPEQLLFSPYRHDCTYVRIGIRQTGEIAKPDGYKLVTRVTNAVVMLGMVSTILELVLKFGKHWLVEPKQRSQSAPAILTSIVHLDHDETQHQRNGGHDAGELDEVVTSPTASEPISHK